MFLKSALWLSLVVCSSAALAWNGTGHEQIADIAWAKLSPRAKVQVAKILIAGDSVTRGDRTNDYGIPAPTSGFTSAYLETVVRPAFRKAASWPDDIKSGESAQYDARIDADNAASPGLRVPSGDTHRARGEDVRCKTWHYYDDPIAAPGDTAPHPARASNAVYALKLIRTKFDAEAKSANPDRNEQLYDLFWIEHLFGDLTQPLHCSESYVLNPTGDAGGNRYMTLAPNSYRPGQPENLHAYWDGGIDNAIAADARLGQGAKFETVTSTWLGVPAGAPSAAEVKDLDPMSWVQSGHSLAIKYVYGGIQPDEAPTDMYKANQAMLCKKLAILGGLRLARYLNETLR